MEEEQKPMEEEEQPETPVEEPAEETPVEEPAEEAPAEEPAEEAPAEEPAEEAPAEEPKSAADLVRDLVNLVNVYKEEEKEGVTTRIDPATADELVAKLEEVAGKL